MKTLKEYDLFNPAPEYCVTHKIYGNVNKELDNIKGLTYVKDFITVEEEKNLIDSINSNEWLGDLKRRVQHYGWKYDYKARSIDYNMFLGPLPDWAQKIAQRLLETSMMDVLPDQLIINEYKPGQGIANHVDCEPCFGDTIVSLSLATSCVMSFINLKSKSKIDALLEPRSLVVIKDDSRYCWSHGIPPRLADEINGIRTNRKLRISMTFRKVVI